MTSPRSWPPEIGQELQGLVPRKGPRIDTPRICKKSYHLPRIFSKSDIFTRAIFGPPKSGESYRGLGSERGQAARCGWSVTNPHILHPEIGQELQGCVPRKGSRNDTPGICKNPNHLLRIFFKSDTFTRGKFWTPQIG